MAKKKTSKKTARAKKPGAKKSAAAGVAAKIGAKRAGASASARGVSTGRGPGPKEIGESLVALCNAGKWDEPCRKWWSDDVESVEGMGMAWRGRAAGMARAQEWYKQNITHGGSAEGPYVGATGFAVKFRLDIEEKATGKRVLAEEIGVYTVKDGKIVREEFMYGTRMEQHAAGSR